MATRERLRHRGAVAIVLAVAVALAAASLVASAGASRAATSRAGSPRVALLLGDSLTTESAPVYAPPSGWRLAFDAWPGVAPCDWLTGTAPALLEDLKGRPAAVVIETAGNDQTRCMEVNGVLPVVGSPDYLARYETALSTVISLSRANGATVILLAPPPMLAPHVDAALKAVLAWAQLTEHVKVSWAPRESVALFGAFTEALPCMRKETAKRGCVRGWIPVRTLDTKYHVHFCPRAAEFTPRFTCEVYSSGETRWARATMGLLRHLA